MHIVGASEEVARLMTKEAILAGERARVIIELEESDDDDYEVARESMRRRLARTLVQLGMRIDPLVMDEEETNAS